MSVQETANLAQLRSFAEPWAALAEQAAEPNVFYEPWALLPALEHLDARAAVRVVLVWSDAAPGQLLGLFPVRRERRYRHLPVQRWATWEHDHCFLCAPLVRRGQEAACWRQFFGWLWRNTPATVFTISKLPVGGELYRSLTDYLATQNTYVDAQEQFDRAALQSTLSYSEYLSANLRPKKAKELRRQRRKLAALGHLESTRFSHAQAHDLDAWIDAFLGLEAKGWKGQAGTAMACKPAETAYAAHLIRGAAACGRLLMHRLSLDARPIAMKLSLTTGRFAFAFKIAYDDGYAAYSPGVLLELDSMRAALDQFQFDCYDSCADADHKMIEQLWRERRRMVNLHISTRRALSKPVMRAMSLAKAAKDRWKSRQAAAD